MANKTIRSPSGAKNGAVTTRTGESVHGSPSQSSLPAAASATKAERRALMSFSAEGAHTAARRGLQLVRAGTQGTTNQDRQVSCSQGVTASAYTLRARASPSRIGVCLIKAPRVSGCVPPFPRCSLVLLFLFFDASRTAIPFSLRLRCARVPVRALV